MKGKRETLMPILRSSLPPLEHMIPYFEKIEPNRCHTNFGSLFKQFEERMANFLGILPTQISISCNGTLSLISSLLAFNIPRDRYCLMPAWTFSATPASAVLAGLKPYFLDVDRNTQTITPNRVYDFLKSGVIAEHEIGAIMPVSPFGAPIDRSSWDSFTDKTGIPVLIDAAASFDTILNTPQMSVGQTPMMVSLHATKIFGIGEGGMIVSTDEELIKRIKGISNFGFDVSRLSSYLGMNCKMSEYQAAIGHVVLDSWSLIRQQRKEVTANYIHHFNKIGLKPWLSLDWLTANCNVFIPGKAEQVRDHLLANNIEARTWWGKGCHTHPAYQNMDRVKDLSNTTYLSDGMLGVPFSIDTSKEDIEFVCSTIDEFLTQNLFFQDHPRGEKKSDNPTDFSFVKSITD